MAKEIISGMYKRYFSHNIGGTASSFAYYFLFSFFPLIIFLNTVVGYFGYSLEEAVAKMAVIPDDVRRIAIECIRHISSNQSAALMLTTLVLSISSASMAVRVLFRAVGQAMGHENHRPTFARAAWSVIFTVMLFIQVFLILIVFVLLEYVTSLIAGFLPEILKYSSIISNVRVAAAAVFGCVSLIILYMIAPGYKIRMRDVLPGALTAEAAWLVVSSAFSYYASNMANYSVLYGSIGALIILMLWFFLTAVILVMGGELNAIIIEYNSGRNSPAP